MRLRHWRMVLFGFAGLFAAIFMGLLAVWLFSAQYTLTVAAGPSDGYGQRFVAALNEAFKPEEPRIRFNALTTSDSEASGQALEAGKADLAILRSDIKPPANGLVIVILRRDAVGLIVPGGSSIKGFADLSGKTVGMLPGSHFNTQLFDQLLSFHGVDPKEVKREAVSGNAITDAIKTKKIDAVFGIGPLGIGPLVDALAAVRRAEPRGKTPVFLPVEDASGFVKAHPAMETVDVPKGAFGGATPVPDDDDTTLALTWRLVAKDSMLDAIAGELARMLVVNKNRLALLMPTAHQIIAPDTDDKSPYLPIHPGAAAYYNDDQESWFDRFEDVFYLVAMFGSILASIGAGAAGYFRRHSHREADLRDLGRLMQELASGKPFDPDEAEQTLNSLVRRGMSLRASHPDDLDDPQVMQLVLSEIRLQIAARRAAIQKSPGT
jgi:TRAP transporter TAXI family solute receptor